jgi:hypothetical protein
MKMATGSRASYERFYSMADSAVHQEFRLNDDICVSEATDGVSLLPTFHR